MAGQKDSENERKLHGDGGQKRSRIEQKKQFIFMRSVRHYSVHYTSVPIPMLYLQNWLVFCIV